MTIIRMPPEMPYGINVVEKRPTMTLTDSIIGSGATSDVYWGFSHVGSPLAVKKLTNRVTAEHETKAFKIGIPHTPRFRDYFVKESGYHIVMDRVNEKTIERLYLNEKATRMLSFHEILSIVHQTLEALVCCEERNIILFDLKTDNLIWQAASRTLTLIDLGSVSEARNEYELDPLQTPEYLAPEWMLKGKITPSYDIWSLGCVLYQLIVGKNLFSRHESFGWDVSEDHWNIYDGILWQIVSEMGRPSEAYLAGCKRAKWFAEVFSINEFPEVPKESSWESNVRQALSDGGMEEQEMQEWVQLLKSMLCYENRASAKTLLKHPIFQGEIHVNLKSDPTIKCTLLLHRQSKVSQSGGSEDLTIDLNSDKNRCLHIPRDPKGEYRMTLQTDEVELTDSISLKNDGILDITSYQAQLRDFKPSPLESSHKKSKIDESFAC